MLPLLVSKKPQVSLLHPESGGVDSIAKTQAGMPPKNKKRKREAAESEETPEHDGDLFQFNVSEL